MCCDINVWVMAVVLKRFACVGQVVEITASHALLDQVLHNSLDTVPGSETSNSRYKESVIKGKVFYRQEPPSGESTTTECEFNYQVLAVILLK